MPKTYNILKMDKDAFIKQVESMSVVELNDLVKALEEKFGVSAAAMAAPVAGGAGEDRQRQNDCFGLYRLSPKGGFREDR